MKDFICVGITKANVCQSSGIPNAIIVIIMSFMFVQSVNMIMIIMQCFGKGDYLKLYIVYCNLFTMLVTLQVAIKCGKFLYCYYTATFFLFCMRKQSPHKCFLRSFYYVCTLKVVYKTHVLYDDWSK